MNVIAKTVPSSLAEDYFAQVESFQSDHLRTQRRARNTAWVVAAIACAVAVLEGAAIASLAPLHTVEWRLVRVDSSSGAVDDVTTLKEAPKTVNEANVRYFLAQYVRLRESYVAPEAKYNFHAVSLMSSPDEQMRFATEFKGSNPHSPQVVFGKEGFIRINIESVSMLGPQLGQVRFAREEVRSGSQPMLTHWVATIGFEWRPDALISNADRELNPIGFQVSDYHADAVAPGAN